MDNNNTNYNHLFKSKKTYYPLHDFDSCSGGWCWSWKDSSLDKVLTIIKIINRQLYINVDIPSRYVKGKLPQNKPSTIGVEFATKNIELKNGGGIVKA